MRNVVFFALAVIGVAADPEWVWNLPKGFPTPPVPADNPMTAPKVELGRYLFYDTRMSVNGKSSCASCHQQKRAFTDGHPLAIGTTGETHPRNAMSLVNVAYAGALTWSNPKLKNLENQALVPMYGGHPVELGLRDGDAFLSMLRADPIYKRLFATAYPADRHPFRRDNVVKAISCFERSIISGRSPYDRYHYGGDDSAVSQSAKRGEVLFFNQHLSCFRCHGGFNFSDSSVSERTAEHEIAFHNTGLYLEYPAPNVGVYEYTHAPADRGKFKTPTLRNIELTAPYMHDGSVATLDAVLDHYSAGGRGHDNPNKDPLIEGFALSAKDRADLIEFLKTLTDDEFVRDSRFGDPWKRK